MRTLAFVFGVMSLIAAPLARSSETLLYDSDYEAPETIFINYGTGDSGDPTERGHGIITDSGNQVMEFWLKSNNDGPNKGRVQWIADADVALNNTTNYRQYQKMKFHPNLNVIESNSGDYPGFHTFVEIWNNKGWGNPPDPYPFRLSINIKKIEGVGGELIFGAHAQCKVGGRWQPGTVWSVNSDADVATGDLKTRYVEVPVDEWFELEYYFYQGDATSGRFQLNIRRQGAAWENVFDVTGYTHHPSDPNPDGIQNLHALKHYIGTGAISHVNNNAGNSEGIRTFWDEVTLLDRGTRAVPPAPDGTG